MSRPPDNSLAPDGLAAADADRLDGLVAEALARQNAALDRAIEGGLDHIPRLLQSPVKKLLFR